jgi:Family of unknown function (DUF5681)
MDGHDNTGRKQATGRFAKGVSGNPNGRPRGSRNKASLLAETLLEGQAEKLIEKAIELALQGNVAALRCLIERLLPAKREQAITIELPPINSADDAKTAMAAIITAVARGELLSSEARELAQMIETFIAAAEATDLERRLHQVEQQLERNK